MSTIHYRASQGVMDKIMDGRMECEPKPDGGWKIGYDALRVTRTKDGFSISLMSEGEELFVADAYVMISERESVTIAGLEGKCHVALSSN